MSHDHSHHAHYHDADAGTKNIITAFWMNTIFAVLEIAGGFLTNSVAILSDAVHDLGDSLSLGLAYYFARKSKQQRDATFSYGYKRFSLLGAFVTSMILIISSIFILEEAIGRLFNPSMPDVKGMAAFAIFGIVVNGVVMLRLQKGKSITERVVSLHFLEDVLGWAAVLVASVVMNFVELPILDPILSILIAFYILWNVFKSLRTTFRILLQGSPENVDQEELKRQVLAIPGVKDIHDLHFWTMDGQYNVMTLHVMVDRNTTASQMEELKKEVRHCLHHLNLQHITIEMELEGSHCVSGPRVAEA